MIVLWAVAALAMQQDTIVVRAGAAVWGNAVTVTRELQIGAVDGPEESTFGMLTAMTVGPDGSMFGIDIAPNTVREFDANGRYTRSFGRRGQGPGELQGPEAAVIVNNRLVVRDLRNVRMTVYPLDGGEPEHWSFRSSSGGFAPMTVLRDGGIATPIAVNRGGNEWEHGVIRYTGQGAIRDTVFAPRIAYEPRRLIVTAGGGQAAYSIPYEPAPVWTYLPDGSFAGGLPSRAAIVVTRPGRTVRLERPAAAVRVSSDERADLQDAIVATIRSANDPQFRWRGAGIPESKPYFSAIHVDADARLWVRVATESRRIPPGRAGDRPHYVEPQHFDVYDANLRYLGRVRLPETFTFGFAHGEQVWGIDRDELGVQYIVRYRLHRS